MNNKILNNINDERISFDLEKSHTLLGGSKYFMASFLTEGTADELIETLMAFQEEGLDAWYNLDSNTLIHEIVH
jgi:hypothetical protein